jgi:hypothetical protein
MKLFLFLFFLIISTETVLAQMSYISPTKTLNKRSYQLGISTDYFNSSSRIDADGQTQDFDSGESFSRIQTEVSGSYGLIDHLQISGGVRYRQNNSTVINTLTGEAENDVSSGVESTFVNILYAFPTVDRMTYALEGSFRFRTFSNQETNATGQGELILGDEGNDYGASFAATYSSRANNFLSGKVGYKNPGEHLSPELVWQVEGAMAWRYLALIAGVDGVSSLNNDPYGNNPTNKPVFYTGSTFLYHSTNRELIAPYAGVNIALGETWRVEMKGSQVVSGRSTDLGTAYGISLIRRVEKIKANKTDKSFKEYDFEATVTQVSPKKGYLVIDKGISEDVQKGMKIDFFEFDYVGGNILLARGIVIEAKSETSVVKITQVFNAKKEIKEGVLARGSFR